MNGCYLDRPIDQYDPLYYEDHLNDDFEYYSDEVDPEIEEKLYSMVHHKYDGSDLPKLEEKTGVKQSPLKTEEKVKTNRGVPTEIAKYHMWAKNVLHAESAEDNNEWDLNSKNSLGRMPIESNRGARKSQSHVLSKFLLPAKECSTSANSSETGNKVKVTYDESDSDCVIISDSEDETKIPRRSTANSIPFFTNKSGKRSADDAGMSAPRHKKMALPNGVKPFDGRLQSLQQAKRARQLFGLTDSSDGSDGSYERVASSLTIKQLKLSNVGGSNQGLSRIALDSRTKAYYEDEYESNMSDCHEYTEVSLAMLDTLPADKRKFKRIKRNPGEDPKLWKLDVKDLTPTSKAARYYQLSKYCHHCKKYGNHPDKLCSTPKREMCCVLCAGKGHLGDYCRLDRCHRCSEVGHKTSGCNRSRRPVCSVCKTKGHDESSCTFHWRKYCLVNSIVNQNKIMKNASDYKINPHKSCSNCAGKHLAMECTTPAPDIRYTCSPIFSVRVQPTSKRINSGNQSAKFINERAQRMVMKEDAKSRRVEKKKKKRKIRQLQKFRADEDEEKTPQKSMKLRKREVAKRIKFT